MRNSSLRYPPKLIARRLNDRVANNNSGNPNEVLDFDDYSSLRNNSNNSWDKWKKVVEALKLWRMSFCFE